MGCAPSIPLRQGHLLGKFCAFTFLVRNIWDSILLAVLPYISTIAVSVFIDKNIVISISCLLS